MSFSFSVLTSPQTSFLSLSSVFGITAVVEAILLFAVFGIVLVLIYYCAKIRARIDSEYSFNNHTATILSCTDKSLILSLV